MSLVPMVKCVNCSREAVGGSRKCPGCRHRTAKTQRKCRARNREHGLCHCGRARLDNYRQCQRCQTGTVRSERRREGDMSAKHLYVATTAFGVKIGASVNPTRRIRQLQRDVFANLPPCDARLLKT